MKTPLVSIACLTYNHVNYIKQCLDGFLIQETDFSIEILIHDDASTDGTADIIRSYEKKYPEIIKPIYQNVNQYSQGIKISRTYNFSRVKGKYIAICEGDDYWTDPKKLQKQVNFLEANRDYGLVHTDHDRLYQWNGVIKKQINKHLNERFVNFENPFYGILTGKYSIVTASVVVRKDLIKSALAEKINNNPNNIGGDLALWLEISKHSKIKYFDDVTVTYRILKNSMSHQSSISNKFKYQESSKRIRLDFALKYKVPKDVLEIVENMYYNVLLQKAYYTKDRSLAELAYSKLSTNFSLMNTLKYLAVSNIVLGKLVNPFRICRLWIQQNISFKEY